jgi:hypothetical protein
MKISVYADDVCTILDSASNYSGLQHHLAQYFKVSNARFNEEKTKAFALSEYPEEA